MNFCPSCQCPCCLLLARIHPVFVQVHGAGQPLHAGDLPDGGHVAAQEHPRDEEGVCVLRDGRHAAPAAEVQLGRRPHHLRPGEGEAPQRDLQLLPSSRTWSGPGSGTP